MPCLMRPDAINYFPMKIDGMDIGDIICNAVGDHPALMSTLLLEYFLRGEEIGRMYEKGLVDSKWFGCLAAVPPQEIKLTIERLYTNNHIVKTGGFYPALILNEAVVKLKK